MNNLPRRNSYRLIAILFCGLAIFTTHSSLAQSTDSSANSELDQAAMDSVLKAQAERIEIIKRISSCTLAVFGPSGGGGGSGVIITPDGYALTNYHVTKPCGDYMRCGMNDGKLYDAVIVGIDPTGDVALIKLLGKDKFPTTELGDSDLLSAGDWCYVVGNPFLLATDFTPTVTYGIISGTHRYQYPAGTLLEYADCIQTDASINPGNSGGPLFNSAGQLVGINGRGSFEKRGRVNVGVGYAISINQIKKFYGYLRSGRVVDHATLGATVTTGEEGGVYVSDIIATSDAYRRGMRFDDEVVSVGGKPVSTANEVKNILGTYPKGWKIPISYRHDGERRDVLVRLMGVHSREELIQQVQGGPQQIEVQPRRPGEDPQGEEDKDDGDGDDEGDNEDAPKDDNDKPRLPDRIPERIRRMMPTKVKMPDEVKSLIESRRGYANYHFNKQNRDRVWQAFGKYLDMAGKNGEWVLTGNVAENSPFEIILRDDEAFIDIPQGQSRITLTRDLDEELAPKGSGGALLAISMWRRLLTLGPDKFGEVLYLGTQPHAAAGTEVDVFQAIHDAIQMQFYFDPDNGQLLSFELFPSIEHETCEVTLGNFGPLLPGNAKQIFPRTMRVKTGDFEFATFEIGNLRITGEKIGTEL
ncbi:MAG: trypsin-like peptidase domain-containing protein [Planctomycetota bacterium]